MIYVTERMFVHGSTEFGKLSGVLLGFSHRDVDDVWSSAILLYYIIPRKT